MIKSRIFLVMIFILLSSTARALSWDDLWLNPDEQGYKALQHNNLQQAAQEFKSPKWQGVVYYRLKEYTQALAAFSKGTDATAFYNRANTLALLGRYPEAISAYDKALALNPSLGDAQFNRDLLKHLLSSTSSNAPTIQTAPPFKQHYNNRHHLPQDNAVPPSDSKAPTTKAPQNSPEPAEQPQPDPTPPTDTNVDLGSLSNTYQDQQQQQALQNINDDPGGLLQKKLARDYEQSQQQGN